MLNSLPLFPTLRNALRQIRSAPGFSIVVVLTLALGIGANVAIFSVINATFLKGLPYPHAERLVEVMEQSSRYSDMSVSYPNFKDWHLQQQAFSALAIFHDEGRTLTLPDSVERVSVGMVSTDFFSVLGTVPAQGRAMRAQDDQEGAALVAWVTHDLWQRKLGGASSVVGRTIRLGEQSVEVAGILPPEFRFLRKVDVVMPIAPMVQQAFMDSRDNHNNAFVVGRLKPGVTQNMGASDLGLIARRLEEQYPGSNKSVGVKVRSLREATSSDARSQVFLLFSAVALVLLIACVNVANMQLARSFGREKEMAIRAAIGASRWQLIQQLFIENLLLSGAGALIGTFVGSWGFRMVRSLVPWQIQNLVSTDAGMDWRILAFVTAIAVVTGIGFGFAPAWRLSHADPHAALKSSTSVVRGWFGRWRIGDLLVTAQVALALMLVIGAGLVIRSFDKLLQVDPGFRPERVLTLEVPAAPASLYQRDPNAISTYVENALDAARGVTEVDSCAMVSSLPFTSNVSKMMFYRDDIAVPPSEQTSAASYHAITADYFRTMGIPLLVGRGLSGHEAQPKAPPGFEFNMANIIKLYNGFEMDGVVSKRMADRFWPGENPVGQHFRLGRPDMEFGIVRIVGVVGNTTQEGLDQDTAEEFYLSSKQFPLLGSMHLVTRSRTSDASRLIGPLRAALRPVTYGNPIQDIKLLRERVEGSTGDRTFKTGLLAFFAGTALFLALVGIYGVLSSNVGRRFREMGIRFALGAQRASVLGSVLGRSLILVGLGSVIGLWGAWELTRLIRSQLFGITATDPFTFTISTVVLLAATFPACLLPAIRAARVSPTVALRQE